VVVGDGPERDQLEAAAPANVAFAGRLADPQLRWAYRSAQAVVCASFEDFGLVPLEANAHGVPAVALRAGGYLDTVVEGATGVFVDEPTPAAIGRGVVAVAAGGWRPADLAAHAARFDEAAFGERLRQMAAETAR
jgi:glycosyltransferase involved in cell wall biosynthesis